MRATEFVTEKWSAKYKRSINCANPRGFSQRAHCQGRKKNEDITEALLVTDVPNEDWLEGKREYAKSRGRDSFGVPYMGSTTGYVRQPSQVELPVDLLARIPGARAEQSNVRYDDLKAIMKIMQDTGKLPLDRNGKEYMPFITVAWDGSPWVSEGNHRIMAARRLGWKTLPVELKYFDGGERVESGPLYPGKIGLQKPKPGSTIVMNVDEMALAQYQPMGNFEKPGPFRGVDKKLVPHPKNQLKAAKFFERTPYDFRLFFSNIPGTGRYSEYGAMDPKTVEIIFGDAAKDIIDGHDNAITVVFVGNKGDSKVMLTPWMMAHRFGHAVQVGARSKKEWSAWNEAENHFFRAVNNLLYEYYGKIGKPGGNLKWELTPEYNALFNAIGTQRSSRSGEIRRPYEFLYELFAQYLGTGKVVLNPFPTTLGYGRRAWGNPTRYMNIKPEYRDGNDRQHASEVLAKDMEMMFNDVLSSSVGRIYVM